MKTRSHWLWGKQKGIAPKCCLLLPRFPFLLPLSFSLPPSQTWLCSQVWPWICLSSGGIIGIYCYTQFMQYWGFYPEKARQALYLPRYIPKPLLLLLLPPPPLLLSSVYYSNMAMLERVLGWVMVAKTESKSCQISHVIFHSKKCCCSWQSDTNLAATIPPPTCSKELHPLTVVFLALQVDTQNPKGAAALWAFILFLGIEQNPVYQILWGQSKQCLCLVF